MDTYDTSQPFEYLMYKQIMSTEEIKLLKSVQTSARLEFIQRWVMPMPFKLKKKILPTIIIIIRRRRRKKAKEMPVKLIWTIFFCDFFN